MTDVLIIGAGPTGLTLACDLARRGVAHRIVERDRVPNHASRAKTIQPRSLEVLDDLDDLGAVGHVLRHGVASLPMLGLGYGLAAPGVLGLLFGLPSIGIVAGGTLAGWLASRVGPATTLAFGVALGAVGTTGMLLGASELAVAVCCSFLLSLTAGTLVTSGFNMAGFLAPAERQGVVSSLVMVMTAIGSVLLNFVGTAVLKSTAVVVDGVRENSLRGVQSYITMAIGSFVLAGVVAVVLLRTQRQRS